MIAVGILAFASLTSMQFLTTQITIQKSAKRSNEWIDTRRHVRAFLDCSYTFSNSSGCNTNASTQIDAYSRENSIFISADGSTVFSNIHQVRVKCGTDYGEGQLLVEHKLVAQPSDSWTDLYRGLPYDCLPALTTPPSVVYLKTSPTMALFGRDVGVADINNDGFADLHISDADSVYVIMGKEFGWNSPITVNTEADYRLTSVTPNDTTYAYPGMAFGDINNDGIQDAVFSDTSEVRVVYGSTGSGPYAPGPTSTIESLATVAATGFTIQGKDPDSQLGRGGVGVGDINADGYADILTGDPVVDVGGPNYGEMYAIFGGATLGATFDLSLTPLDGSNGVEFPNTSYSGRSFGRRGAWTGDFDGDGIQDAFLYHDTNISVGGSNTEGFWVVYGQATWTSPVNIVSPFSSDPNVMLRVGSNYMRTPSFGDLDNDGKIDAFLDRNGTGDDSKVILGNNNYDQSISAPDHNISHSNFSHKCWAVADLNGDGIDDLIACNRVSFGNRYIAIIFGPITSNVSLSASTYNGVNTVKLQTTTHTREVRSGDLNNDGYNDLILLDEDTRRGWIVFGRADWSATPTIDLNSYIE